MESANLRLLPAERRVFLGSFPESELKDLCTTSILRRRSPDIGEKEDYRTAKMPPVNTGLLDGELAWRQHDGGHEDRSNMKHFIAWANKFIKHTPPPAAPAK